MRTVIDYYHDAVKRLRGGGGSLIGIPFDTLVAVNVARRQAAEKEAVRNDALIDQLEYDARLMQAAMEFTSIAVERRPDVKEG